MKRETAKSLQTQRRIQIDKEANSLAFKIVGYSILVVGAINIIAPFIFKVI